MSDNINKYQYGKIYKIVSKCTDLVYIGSTAEPFLEDRMDQHVLLYNRWTRDPERKRISAFEILKYVDANIELLEEFPCNSKAELLIREQYWMDRTKNTVNENNAIGRDQAKIKGHEAVKVEKRKTCPKWKGYTKAYTLERAKIYVECDCGKLVKKSTIARHKRSEIHYSAVIQTI